MKRKLSQTFAILLIVTGGIFLVSFTFPGTNYQSLWPLALIAAGVVWLVPMKSKTKQPTQPTN